MIIQNQIPYFIEEMKKIVKLSQDLESEYGGRVKNRRYKELSQNYQGRIQGYLDKINGVGKIGVIVKVTAQIMGVFSESPKVTVFEKSKPIELFYINISEQDVALILNRDEPTLKNVKLETIIPGNLIF